MSISSFSQIQKVPAAVNAKEHKVFPLGRRAVHIWPPASFQDGSILPHGCIKSESLRQEKLHRCNSCSAPAMQLPHPIFSGIRHFPSAILKPGRRFPKLRHSARIAVPALPRNGALLWYRNHKHPVWLRLSFQSGGTANGLDCGTVFPGQFPQSLVPGPTQN